MTARSSLPSSARRHPGRRVPVLQLDRRELVGLVRRYAAIDVDERTILAATGLDKDLVRRALGAQS